jgi:2',3'-cyclic-nucleotide 2'-phosphodiesterase / 3'-nucleotidase
VIQGWKRVMKILLLIIITLQTVFNSTKAKQPAEPTIQIRIMETTDLHARMLGFDYDKLMPNVEYGLEWTSSLIKKARNEVPNSLLFDVGDVLVGNDLAEYISKTYQFNWREVHPVYKVMNLLEYDAATVGNHEFNYGLDFLSESLRGASFPYVNANIYMEDHNKYDGDDLNYFNPYLIIDKEFSDSNGQKFLIKVGVIGLITPIAAEWDRESFHGKLRIKNMREAAEHFIPIMKQQGADIIVVLAHTGLEADKGLKHKSGNSVYALSKVDGIDAILFGHSHSLFPVKDGLAMLKGMDSISGTINGTAVVQAGYWGNHLGIIDLNLIKQNGKWKVIKKQSSVKPIYRTLNQRKIPVVPSDSFIKKVMEKYHRTILDYTEDGN